MPPVNLPKGQRHATSRVPKQAVRAMNGGSHPEPRLQRPSLSAAYAWLGRVVGALPADRLPDRDADQWGPARRPVRIWSQTGGHPAGSAGIERTRRSEKSLLTGPPGSRWYVPSQPEGEFELSND